jgi:DNA invertase Pin-like site-specific DNA recombinase
VIRALGSPMAVAYCRVSTLEQKKKGYGIEIQVRDVTLFAQAQGLDLRKREGGRMRTVNFRAPDMGTE